MFPSYAEAALDAKERIRRLAKQSNEVPQFIVAGGPWFDHIGLSLVKMNPDLLAEHTTLILPCQFSPFAQAFDDHTLNTTHKRFTDWLGRGNSLETIAMVASKGNMVVEQDIKKRANKLADTDFLLCYTFGRQEPTDGWIRMVWKRVPHGNRLHVSLMMLRDKVALRMPEPQPDED